MKPTDKKVAIKEEGKEKSLAFKAFKSFKPRKFVNEEF